MIWCDVTWYDMTWYDMIWHDMIWHDMTWHDIFIPNAYSSLTQSQKKVVHSIIGKITNNTEQKLFHLLNSTDFIPLISVYWFYHADIPDTGLLCDLLWADPDKDIVGWGENDRGVSFTFGEDVVAQFLRRYVRTLLRLYVCLVWRKGRKCEENGGKEEEGRTIERMDWGIREEKGEMVSMKRGKGGWENEREMISSCFTNSKIINHCCSSNGLRIENSY